METCIFDIQANRIGTDSVKWQDASSGIIPMHVADMDFVTPPEIISAINNRVSQQSFGYATIPDSYYESIHDWLLVRDGCCVEREWILYSLGVIPSICMAIKALSKEGDKVIIQTPVYPAFYRAIDFNNRQVIENKLICQTGNYYIDFDDLEKKASDSDTKLLLLCNPHNPIGRVWTRDEVKCISEICIKHNVIVISDEIHSDLIYPNCQFTSIASLSKEAQNNSVCCIAPSKTFNIPSLKHSMIIVSNEEMRNKINYIRHNELFIDEGDILGYYAAEAGYTYGRSWIEDLMKYIEGNYIFLKSYLEKNIPQVKITQPQATYLGWLDFRELGLSEESLNDILLNKIKVRVADGKDFSLEYNLFKRVTLACPRHIIENVIERIDSLNIW